MKFNIIKMESKRLFKTILQAVLVTVGYSALIMVFYISFSELMGSLGSVFNDSSLSGILRAFSMDINTFSYILNFYVSYSSIYVILIGCIYAGVLIVRIFSAEVRDGTYEFIYSKPASRTSFFVSKTAVVMAFILVMNILLFSTGLILLESLKSQSPPVPWLDRDNREMLAEASYGKESALLQVFTLDETLFYNVVSDTISTGIESSEDSMKDMGLDGAQMKALMESFLQNPDALMKEIIENPDGYMEMFGIPPSERDKFISDIGAQMTEFQYLKDNFSNPAVAMELFSINPRPFLQQAADRGMTEEFGDAFGLSDKQTESLFRRYSFRNYLLVSVITMLIMLAVASVCILISVAVRRGKFSSGMAVGVIMAFYFTDIISNISDKAEFLKYITPFGYLNTDVMNVGYAVEPRIWISLGGIIAACLVCAWLVFRRTDLQSG